MVNNWYRDHLKTILTEGEDVAPRGLPCREVLDLRIQVQRDNVVVNAARKANYRFMVAEWLWIWFGRDDVETIARYNGEMAKYSDDGQRLAGAYGPRFKHQLPRVLKQLQDLETRQAVAVIWAPHELDRNASKDYPCTLAWQFFIRDGSLHMTATMRSSDAWWGVPYDVFTFSQILACVAATLGLKPGRLTLNMASAHLYEPHWLPALQTLTAPSYVLESPDLRTPPPAWLEDVLVTGVMPPHDGGVYSPWHYYGQALASKTSADALSWLRRLQRDRDVF